ncbi:hypothetical protein SAMN05660337_1216 [Maridesulfovibrio ferrireducens]|uniref:Conjugal transfer protein TraJ n=1 Tax=Maridesulfovibrio ferrireducens TaxID=246191 RepID=A0A1G9EQ75_9BACT|nr:conjugal transfer protein TraJ [Maridesulfovibrio ferrireducens]SDK78244.1 hypothetical protein SAMN05660337_1216 [Maridesulfovibrio ferrireducens]
MPSKKKVLKSYVSEAEYCEIKAKAQQCSLSASELIKRLTLGHEIKSREDQQARRELLKINADLARLGGLLKMWILDDDKHRLDVEKLLKDLRQRQKELCEKVMSL